MPPVPALRRLCVPPVARALFGRVLAAVVAAVLAAVFAAPAAAQGRGASQVEVEFGLGAGRLDHDTNDSGRDGRAQAGFAQLGFEAFGDSGLGGGLRLEAIASQSDLLDAGGIAQVEGNLGEVFAHVSYLIDPQPFGTWQTQLPLRFGVLLHRNELDLRSLGVKEEYDTFGFRFEAEPRIRLIRDGDFELYLFAQVGVGSGWTNIEITNNPTEFDSSSSFFGVEAGFRARVGPVSVGVAYVHREHSMDDSEREAGGAFVNGFDATFDGVMVTFGAVF